jgi:hypothetical protein
MAQDKEALSLVRGTESPSLREERELARLDVSLTDDFTDPRTFIDGNEAQEGISEYRETSDDTSDIVSRTSRQPAERLTDLAQSVKALSYWDAKTRKTFNRLPEDVRRVWLTNAHRDQVRYERALAQLDSDVAPWVEIAKVLAPIANNILPKYGTFKNYVHALVIEDGIVGTDPAIHIARIMRDLNVTPQMVVSAQGRLEQTEQQMMNTIPAQVQAQETQEKYEALLREQEEKEATEERRALDNFFAQRDKRGNLLYPEFNELREELYNLVVSMDSKARAEGRVLQPSDIDLDMLYRKAKVVRDTMRRNSGTRQPNIGINKEVMGDEPLNLESRPRVSRGGVSGPYDMSKIDLNDPRIYRMMAAEAEGRMDPSEVSYGDSGGDE